MAETLTSTITVSISAALQNAITPGSAIANLGTSYSTNFTNGTGAGQANSAYWATRTLSASTSEQLDLAGTTLQDAFGQNVSMARIKVLAVAADAGNTNNVVVGGGSNAVAGLFGATTHTAVIRPGGVICWLCGSGDATGYALTGGTADLLQIANSGSGTSVSYTLAVIGATA